eukprot:6737264-Prymnesium_polylepis.1
MWGAGGAHADDRRHALLKLLPNEGSGKPNEESGKPNEESGKPNDQASTPRASLADAIKQSSNQAIKQSSNHLRRRA